MVIFKRSYKANFFALHSHLLLTIKMIIELLGRALQRTTQFDFVCTLVLGCITLRAYRKKVQRLPLPPGPSSLPLIGNVHDLPEGYGGHDFTKYLDKYGTRHNSKGSSVLLT